jgi:holo-[acyl-carrier protein] synthase
MSRHEVGIDLIEIERIVRVLGRFPQRFRQRVLTEAEQRYCGDRVERIAGRWAAKEAVSKVLGLGVRGVGWREIEVLPDWAGKPHVFLHDRAARRATSMGIREIAVSITHERSMAAAVAHGEREGES